MSFLDNLENTLKSLEGREQRDPEQMERERIAREQAREHALRTAPYAELLRSSPFTSQLLTACRTEGHRLRRLVRITWLEGTLRLETGTSRLDLEPVPDGVRATIRHDGEAIHSEMVDFDADPQLLARRWLSSEA
jgi:hypothetical protein